jgi:fibronectin type 3 domain-containing protein
MDLAGRATPPGDKGPAVPTLTLPDALDLEAAFKVQPGQTLRLALAPDFVFEGTVTLSTSAPDGLQAVVGATDGVSQLNLARERPGRYRGFISHADSPLAHRLSTTGDGKFVIQQVKLSDIICAPEGATGAGPLGLPAASAAPAPAAATPASTVPILDSRPDATAVIYLDFDGQTVRNTEWNSRQNIATITAQASALSETQINEVWRSVAEDFSPFNISVTTSASRYAAAPGSRRIRVIITPTSAWWGADGGVAFIGSFRWTDDVPCWVFENNLGRSAKNVAEAASHEVGHTFDLKHDGRNPPDENTQGNGAYYQGFADALADWAPIMGVGYDRAFVQWSRGEYAGANEPEDDLAIIASVANGFGYRVDDKGDTLGSAAALRFQAGSTTVVSDGGVVEKSTDVDLMRFTTGNGGVNFSIRGAEVSPNLFLRVDLLDSFGTVLNTFSSTLATPAVAFSRQVTAGVYYLRVSGRGFPVPSGTVGPYRYDASGYGSIGQYTVTGTLPSSQPVPVLSVNTSALALTVERGQDAQPRTFTVRNTGTGSVAYTVTENLPWLSVSPASGTSAGESVTHTLNFTTAALAAGLYEGAVTVAAPGVEGSPQTVNVTLNVTTPSTNRVFQNTAAITIPSSGPNGAASPYPSTIEVSGLPSNVSSVAVDLRGLSHDWPEDLNILLVAPNGQNVMLMSDAGGSGSLRIVEANLTFRDDGAPLPQSTQVVGGIYRPTRYSPGNFLLPPAPTAPYGANLAATLAGGVNGTWRLFVFDDFPWAAGGAIAGGWALTFGSDGTELPSPTGVIASDGTFNDRVRLTWQAATGASAYRVFRATRNDSASASLLATVTATTFEDTDALPGTTYFYWVRSAAGDRVSAFSAPDSGFRAEVLPDSNNDNFSGRLALEGADLAVQASNAAATREDGEPLHAGKPGGRSLWWSWTAPANGTLRVGTEGSSFDTLLAVYTGGALGSLVAMASDDDSGPNLTSRVELTVAANTTYQIAVDGYNGAGGSIALSLAFDTTKSRPPPPASVSASDGTFNDRVQVTWSAAPTAVSYDIYRGTGSDLAAATLLGSVPAPGQAYSDTTAVAGTNYNYWVAARNEAGASAATGPDAGLRAVKAVSNDNFAEAFVLEGGSVAVGGSNAQATKESGEPDHAGAAGGKSVWWTWTAPQNGAVTIDTSGSGFDTLLGIYRGTAVGNLTLVASDDDSGQGLASQVEFTAVKDTTYRIAVDGYGGASGLIALQLALQGAGSPPPAPASVEATAGEFPDRVRISWSASSGATSYLIRRGTSPEYNASSPLAPTGAAVSSYEDTTVVPGNTYFYWVLALNGAGSSSPGGPAAGFTSLATTGNDNFAEASEITGNAGVRLADNNAATAQAGEPAHAGNPAGRSLWWKWTAPQSGTLTVSTAGSSFDTVLAVYTGTSLADLSAAAANDDAIGTRTSEVVLSVTAGTTYHIAVDGFRGVSGAVRLRLQADYDAGTILLTGNLAFGSLAAGQSAQRTFTIANTSTAPVGVSTISLPLGFTANWSGGPIAAGAERAVQVTFTPPAAGSFGGQVLVSFGASSVRTLPVGGTGTVSDSTRRLEDLALALHRRSFAGFIGSTGPIGGETRPAGQTAGVIGFRAASAFVSGGALSARVVQVSARVGSTRYFAASLSVNPDGTLLAGTLAGPRGARLVLSLAIAESNGLVSLTGTATDPASQRVWPVVVYARAPSPDPRRLVGLFFDGDNVINGLFQARVARTGVVRFAGLAPDGRAFTASGPAVIKDSANQAVFLARHLAARRALLAGDFVLPREPGDGPHLTGTALWVTDDPALVLPLSVQGEPSAAPAR